MAGMKDITNVWKNIREVDLRPIREAAKQPVKIALVGVVGSGRHTLAGQMRVDPLHPGMQTQTPLMIADLDDPDWVSGAEFIVLMIDANSKDSAREQELARRWVDSGKKVLVFINKIDLLDHGQMLDDWASWQLEHLVYASANNANSLIQRFAPAVIQLLPDQLIPMARQFPLFRGPVSNHLIGEACFSNAAYAFSSGLAGIVPALIVPMNISDMVVLSKAQAFLVYKLGLALGLSTEWRDYVAEFGGVIGGGFMWRQLARQLVGLIPIWGIAPKVGVAYAGTYVVGHAVVKWYLTGRHLSRQQMREFYIQAFSKGKALGKQLLAKAPRPRLFKGRQARLKPPEGVINCQNCGKPNAKDAHFCQYCGKVLSGAAPH